ncbi:MAG: orotidine 5'-phosphate decarboxylase, partial [Betaproteobacteria bacterium]|nr:orotidine 5'-phosphate decarboxylase [Betaproteobacteria bacterium]
MNFMQSLRAAWRERDTLLCVGLDPDTARLPPSLAGSPRAIFEFCRDIV